MSSDDYVVFATTFECQKCGQHGAALWERRDSKTAMVNLSNGFYEKAEGELVCAVCECGVPKDAHRVTET